MNNKWHYRIMSEFYGPVDSATLRQLAVRNDINRDTFVRRNDEDWVTADRVEGLFRPPQGVAVHVTQTNVPSIGTECTSVPERNCKHAQYTLGDGIDHDPPKK